MRNSRIGGMVFAAGIGVAVAVGSPVASAEPDSGDGGASDSAESKPAKESKPAGDTKPVSDAKPASDAKSTSDAKPAKDDESKSKQGEQSEQKDDADENDADEKDADETAKTTEAVVDQADEVDQVDEVAPEVDEDAGDAAPVKASRQHSALRVVAPEPEPPIAAAPALDGEPLNRIAEVPTVTALPETTRVVSAAPPVLLSTFAAPVALTPPPVAAPTPPRLLTRVLSLVGLAPWDRAGRGLPILPALHRLLELAFVAIRQHHQYVWHNSTPTITPELVDEDVDTGVRIYDLGIADADRDRVKVTIVQPEHGKVEQNLDGTYTYTPNPEYANLGGPDSFTVTVSDATRFHMHGPFQFGGHTDTETIQFTVAPTNKPPSVTLAELDDPDLEPGAIKYQVTVDDPEGDDVTYAVTTDPSHGTLVDNLDGTYTYKPNAAYAHAVLHGGPDTDSFTVTATDEHGNTGTWTEHVTVAPQNATPTVQLTAGEVDQSTGKVVLTVTSDDQDPTDGTPTYTWEVFGGTVIANPNGDGTYVFTPTSPHTAGTGSIKVIATDEHGEFAEDKVFVSYPVRNQQPSIDLEEVAYDGVTGAITYDPNFEDVDGDAPTYSFVQPAHGNVAVVDGKIVYTPDYAYAHELANGWSTTPGADQFTVTVTDGFGGSDSQVIDVSVKPLNRKPYLTYTVVESGSRLIITITGAEDPDGDEIAMAAGSTVSGTGRVTVDGGILDILNGETRIIVLDPGANGTANYDVGIADSYGGRDQFSAGVASIVAPPL